VPGQVRPALVEPERVTPPRTWALWRGSAAALSAPLRVSLQWSQGREFTLVFRSFGADVAEVVEEMNAFATGQHPCYPDVRAALTPPYHACT